MIYKKTTIILVLLAIFCILLTACYSQKWAEKQIDKLEEAEKASKEAAASEAMKNCEAGIHEWKGYISTGSLKCEYCDAKIDESSIKAKGEQNLSDLDRAYLYWMLDYYLTATDSNGKYRYGEDEAFKIVETACGVSEDYLNTKVWNGYAYNAFHKYYGP